MKKVLYDLAATHPGKLGSVHGGGVYAEVVFKQLISMAEQNTVEVFYFDNKVISPQIIALCQKYQIVQHPIRTMAGVQKLLDSGSFHTLYSALPYGNFTGIDTKLVRFVYTIHGLRELEVPYSTQQWRYSFHWKRLTEWLWAMLFTRSFNYQTKKKFTNLLAKPNSRVITVSNHSKYSLLNFFCSQVTADDIDVFYSPLLESEDASQSTYIVPIEQPFFLVINGNRWVKNSYRALQALEQFYTKHPDCKIKTLILGVQFPPRRFANNPNFIFRGYVERSELESAFKFAYALIYPTLNEGFGYPPLEAMKYGTPVLASAVSSVPEVCGNAVSYFNPYDVAEIENRITEIVFDSDKKESLKQYGLKRYKAIKLKQENMLTNLIDIILDQ
jgi:glycosyltransferase involved in cell wall biosynthesis